MTTAYTMLILSQVVLGSVAVACLLGGAGPRMGSHAVSLRLREEEEPVNAHARPAEAQSPGGTRRARR